MNDLDRVKVGVAEHTNIHASVIALVHNIADVVRRNAIANSLAAQHQLADSLLAHAPVIARHVLANTPIIEATPPVHPLPPEAPAKPLAAPLAPAPAPKGPAPKGA